MRISKVKTFVTSLLASVMLLTSLNTYGILANESVSTSDNQLEGYNNEVREIEVINPIEETENQDILMIDDSNGDSASTFNSENVNVSTLMISLSESSGKLEVGKSYTFSLTIAATPDSKNISIAIPLFDDEIEDFTPFMNFKPNSDEWFTDAEGNKFKYELKELNGKPYLTLKIPKLFKDGENWAIGKEFPLVISFSTGLAPYKFETRLHPYLIDDVQDGFSVLQDFDSGGKDITAINEFNDRTLKMNAGVLSKKLSPGDEVIFPFQFNITNDFSRTLKTNSVFVYQEVETIYVTIPEGLELSSEADHGVKFVERGIELSYPTKTTEYDPSTRVLKIIPQYNLNPNKGEMDNRNLYIQFNNIKIVGEQDEFVFDYKVTSETWDKYDNFFEMQAVNGSQTINYQEEISPLTVNIKTLKELPLMVL